MCYYHETLYSCGCPKECRFTQCQEFLEASKNAEGGYICPKLGNEDKQRTLEIFCDYRVCHVREQWSKKRAQRKLNMIVENEARQREKFRKRIRMADKKLREKAEQRKLEEQIAGEDGRKNQAMKRS